MIPLIILVIEDDADREFMITLYTENYAIMRYAVSKLIHQESIDDDIIQDTTIKLIRKIDTLKSLSKNQTTSYCVRAARNTAIDYRRRTGKEKSEYFLGSIDDAASEFIEENTPESEYINNYEIHRLGEAIKRLSEKDQTLLYYKYNMQMSNDEICKLTGISSSSIRENIARARKRAKKAMESEVVYHG